MSTVATLFNFSGLDRRHAHRYINADLPDDEETFNPPCSWLPAGAWSIQYHYLHSALVGREKQGRTMQEEGCCTV